MTDKASPLALITGVGPGMAAYTEELFGPVASIIPAHDDAHAVSIANDSEFGLGSAVFTRGQTQVLSVATLGPTTNGLASATLNTRRRNDSSRLMSRSPPDRARFFPRTAAIGRDHTMPVPARGGL